jgi:RHS repeat-associated protein
VDYLILPGDPNTLIPAAIDWTDYLDDQPYGDAEVTETGDPQDPWTETETVSYMFPGAQQTVSGGVTQYYHGDLISSTMLTTDDIGDPNVTVTYTAFGEVLNASGTPGGEPPDNSPRYRYAGAWGYESGLLILQGANGNLPAITLQHVGHRWYQPDVGRFIQRDPIGVVAGPNVYAYASNDPLSAVDPAGLTVIDPRDWWEQMRRLNRAIAKNLKLAWSLDPEIRRLARGRLWAALNSRNLLYGMRFGPLMTIGLCIELFTMGLEAAKPHVDDWLDRHDPWRGLNDIHNPKDLLDVLDV